MKCIACACLLIHLLAYCKCAMKKQDSEKPVKQREDDRADCKSHHLIQYPYKEYVQHSYRGKITSALHFEEENKFHQHEHDCAALAAEIDQLHLCL